MSVVLPRGFVASGAACGIKADGRPDLSLVATSDGKPVPAAGVFTTNRAAAAPVRISRKHLRASGGRASAVVLNSGNANSVTGADGRDHAIRSCAAVARLLDTDPYNVLVCSTGLIGIPLAIERIEQSLPALVASRGDTAEHGDRAARAILTTDTVDKQVVVERDGYCVGAMAKGAAMIAPNMATMLAVITTDARVREDELSASLAEAVDASFHRLTIDGATSTNDSVIVLASGRGRAEPSPDDLSVALTEACTHLARAMAGDAEGSTKVMRIVVSGAETVSDARRGARAIAQSLLVKCSIHGADPYWGRVVSDLGSAGIAFDVDRVGISYGGIAVCRDGAAIDHDTGAVARHMEGGEVVITADLGLGSAAAEMFGTDISHAYIDENATTS